MKLLLSSPRYPPDVYSGAETVFASLFQQARQRHQVRLVVGFRRDRHRVPAEAVAVPLGGLGGLDQRVAMARAVWAEARRFKPDVVLSNSFALPPVRRPAIAIAHDLRFGEGDGTFKQRLKQRLAGLRTRSLSAVVTASTASAQALRDIGVPQDRIRVVHHGLDVSHFKPRPELRVADPSDPPGLVRIVHPARILPAKGQHHAIDAVARLRPSYKRRVRLTIVGAVVDPVYLDQIRVQAYGHPVEFALDVPDMAPYCQAADIALQPSVLEDGFASTAVEAMACGVPVVWFELPAIREAIGGRGLPVPPEDVRALRAAIMELMDAPSAREDLGREGQRYVHSNLSWERVWEQYETVLQAVAR